MTNRTNTNATTPARGKKILFAAVTLIFPLLILVLLEIALRAINYGSDLRLFVKAPAGFERYLMINPQIGKRFFYQQETLPSPQNDVFLKEKPANGFRIFLLGGSSAAGYPYGSNIMFSRQLHLRLQKARPDKKIEVVNVSTAAINSYALLDFIDEVLQHQPDLVMLYAGHNEFYGALGVGSAESFASGTTLTRLGLWAQRFKTVHLVRNGLQAFAAIFRGQKKSVQPSATLMERLVKEQTIPLNSALYKSGLKQFRDNLEEIIKRAGRKNIPVLLSELVSNLRDQRPFISVKSSNEPQAIQVYTTALNLERQGKFAEALSAYRRARDLDGLRFRAISDINTIIHELSADYHLPVLATDSVFIAAAKNGLPGDDLFVDHLHPNIRGYRLLGRAFYDKINKLNYLGRLPVGITLPATYSAIDSLYGSIRIRILKGGWPFKPKAAPNNALIDFTAKTKEESLAVDIWTDKQFSLEQAHVKLARYYQQQNQPQKALNEYAALMAQTPFNLSPWLAAADLLIKLQRYDQAFELLQQSLKIEENSFAHKWLGQILLNKNQVAQAIPFLEKAYRQSPADMQLSYNLAGAYAMQHQYQTALEIVERIVKSEPGFPGAKQLQAQLLKAIKNR